MNRLERRSLKELNQFAKLSTAFRQVLPVGSGLEIKETRDQLMFRYGFYVPPNPGQRYLKPSNWRDKFRPDSSLMPPMKYQEGMKPGRPGLSAWPEKQTFVNFNRIYQAGMSDLYKHLLVKIRNAYPDKHISLVLCNEGVLANNPLYLQLMAGKLVASEDAQTFRDRWVELFTPMEQREPGAEQSPKDRPMWKKKNDYWEPIRSWLEYMTVGYRGVQNYDELLYFAVCCGLIPWPSQRWLLNATLEMTQNKGRELELVIFVLSIVRYQTGLSKRDPTDLANILHVLTEKRRSGDVGGVPLRIVKKAFKLMFNDKLHY